MCCTQFGWFQSTSGSQSFRNVHPINLDYQTCTDVFGFTINEVENGIKKTLERYGYPENYNGTNVVLVNGGYDPWGSISSYVNNPETHTTSIKTPGAAHCADMNPYHKTEPKGLNKTRTITEKEVEYFLNL